MKGFLRGILYFFTSLRLVFLKSFARVFGDYILNNYIENCSERSIKHALNSFGSKVDVSSNIKQGLILDNTYFNYGNLEVGENAFVGRKVFMDMANPIIIKKDAVISEGVSIITHQDVGDRMLKEYYKRKDGKVILEEGCWIGANATILCGVRIGKCAVVAAGAVVREDVQDYTVVGGIPAGYIKDLKS